MRHLILELVEKALSKVTVGYKVADDVDETYFPLTFKVPTTIGRKPPKRGTSSGVKGLSNNLVCAVMGTTSTSDKIHQQAGCGFLSKKRALLALCEAVREKGLYQYCSD